MGVGSTEKCFEEGSEVRGLIVGEKDKGGDVVFSRSVDPNTMSFRRTCGYACPLEALTANPKPKETDVGPCSEGGGPDTFEEREAGVGSFER